MSDETSAAKPPATIDSHLHDKNATMAEWLAANPEPETDKGQWQRGKLELLESLYGPDDGAVVELKAELGVAAGEPAKAE